MKRNPSILTNMAFCQSAVWSQTVATICRPGEKPDDLAVWRQVFRLMRLRSSFDAVVTMGPRPSLAYGCLCVIFGLPSKQIMTEVFLDAPRPHSFAWRLKTSLFRLVSKRSLGSLTNSSAEVGLIAQRFLLPETKLRFVPMYTTIEHPASGDESDGSVVSIGRTSRDLDTLFAAARHVNAPFVVVAGKTDRMPSNPPANVHVLREISLEESHRLLARAAVAVIPLLPAERSTGQVVLFEAMAMGKPVVATNAVGTVDYVRDGENGLLVEPNDPVALASAIRRLLDDPSRARQLASAALLDCQTRWLPDHHARHKLDAVAGLWRQSSAPPI